ncbi:MAG: hypothetical protein ABDH16_04060 [Thermodesulfovibrionaceae bacterium]
MSNILKIFYLILIILFIAVSSHAQETKKEKVFKNILDFKNELQLTKDQVEDIKEITDEFKLKESKISKEIQTHEAKLKELLYKEGDIIEIIKEIREIYRLKGELIVEEFLTARKIDAILTAEQKKKWKEIRDKKF